MANDSTGSHDSTAENDRSLARDLAASLANNWVLWLWAVGSLVGLYAVSGMPSAVIEGVFYEVLFATLAVVALAFALKPVFEQRRIFG